MCGVRTQLGAEYEAKAVVIATGTYLDSTVIIGESVVRLAARTECTPA